MVGQPRFLRAGFTLVQLLVIFVLILFLFALLVPILARVRDAATRTQSANNLKQLALGAFSFHDVNGAFPPAIGTVGNNSGTTHFFLLPYLEQQQLYKSAEGAVGNNGVSGTAIPIFVDPADKSAPPGNRFMDWLATTNYAASYPVFLEGRTSVVNIPDGTSNTLMFAQRYQMCNGTPTAWGYAALYTWAPLFALESEGKFQAAPKQEDCDPTLPQSLHPSGIQVAMCDGSVRYVGSHVSAQTWWAATTPSGGEVFGQDWEE